MASILGLLPAQAFAMSVDKRQAPGWATSMWALMGTTTVPRRLTPILPAMQTELNAIEQVVWMDKDPFENFMNDPDEVRYTSSEPVQSILQNISSNLEVEPIENPLDSMFRSSLVCSFKILSYSGAKTATFRLSVQPMVSSRES